jgi:hypothetical protein
MAPKQGGRHVQEAFMVRVEMTLQQRARYVRWWIEASGLTATELREIASGVWADRVFDDTHGAGASKAA